MAWDTGNFCGRDIVTGDEPMDAMGLCLESISRGYIAHLERKPTTAELLYCFKIVLLAAGPELLADPQTLDKMHIQIAENAHDCRS